MKIRERGIINAGEPGSPRAFSVTPSVTPLPDGTLLACYRVGSTKEDCEDETLEIRHSQDGGRTWSAPRSPFAREVAGRRGSLIAGYVTPISDGHLVMAALWADREAHPGKSLYNHETQGLLPTRILLADSRDMGETWSHWRVLLVPEDIGPLGLTNPILKFSSGKLAISAETNKHYEDRSTWFQRVVYFFSEDSGKTWSAPHTVSEDRTGRILNWDQRAECTPDGLLASFAWTYDTQASCYLNIHRRVSRDEGNTWTDAEDLGFADQASHPAVLSDERVFLAWVDRFGTQTIRARMADRIDAPFRPETEVILYDHRITSQHQPGHTTGVGDVMQQISIWQFGLPYAVALPDDDVMVVYYEGNSRSNRISWMRLSPTA